MSNRKKLVIPKRIKDVHGENPTLWSYSKINTYKNCQHDYFLSRIKKLKGDDNIYSASGSVSHDIIEGLYLGNIKYEEMTDRFESDFLDIEISDYKFSSDEEKNERMRNKYKECVFHFFKNHNQIKTKVVTEKLIWIDVEGHVFIGYVDAITKDEDGNYHIIDWKTSTVYTGAKVQDHANQLLLYALGLNQAGVPLDKIRVSWNFMKYCHISYMQKNGKMKTTRAERNKWVDKIKTPLKRDIISFYDCEGWEADLKIEKCIKENNLTSLDKHIQDKYILDDCYVSPEVSEKAIENLKKEFVQQIKEINEKGADEENWSREEIQPHEEYFCNVLCSMRSHCRYYKEYLNKKGIKEKEEDDLMKLLEDELPF